jgi:murein DD-endopeptidase MepM/ murein hydrolase activator NlpD
VVGRSSGATGQNIEVQPGDTVSSLARKHNVPIADLMQANDLRSPALRPGQRLVLPSAGSPRAPLAREAAAPVRPAAAPASVPTTTVGRDWTGTHTLKPGESLYGIARQAGVKVDELQRANGITDVHKLRPGMVLKVPGAPSGASVAAASPAASEAAPAAARAWSPAPSAARVAAAPPAEAPARSAVVDPSAEPARLRIINGSSGTQVASAPEARDTASDAARLAVPSDPPAASASPKAGGTMKLRWPVRGKIIASFGRHADGAHNDGVNVQAPAGTDVLAAEAGVVAYAGSEVKGYGNLVLVRHDNGWVTAYAHNDTLLVQRGDRVRRGQALGKVGMTGSADQPQLHFELRQGSKPVDPMPYMEKL